MRAIVAFGLVRSASPSVDVEQIDRRPVDHGAPDAIFNRNPQAPKILVSPAQTLCGRRCSVAWTINLRFCRIFGGYPSIDEEVSECLIGQGF
jgi:hypothetical protein